jgi:hypothetical protein
MMYALRRWTCALGRWGRVALALLLACAALLLARDARAQDVSGPGAFARNGFGARGMAMANAQIAGRTGRASPYYNPALAPFVSTQRIGVSAAFMTFDRELQFLELATPLGPTAGIAAGVIRAGVDGIDGRDTGGFRTETLSTDEFALFLAFGNRFAERFSAGATLKLYTADYLDGVAEPLAFGLDLGATFGVTERLTVAASVHDLLAAYEWDTSGAFVGGRLTEDRFPVRVQLGAAYVMLEGRLEIQAEYESRLRDAERRTRVTTVTGGGPGEAFATETLRLHDGRGRLGVAWQAVEILELRGGLGRIGAGDGAESLRPSLGFGLDQSIGELRLHAAYAFVLEPYVHDPMHLVTLRFFL